MKNKINGVQITVLESLVYSARLRFSKTVSTDIVYSFVQEVRVVQLLEGCLQTLSDILSVCSHSKHVASCLGFPGGCGNSG